MTTTPRTPAFRFFRIAAIAEAVSWALLLAGMFVKWVLGTSDLGVEIAGPIHGAMFIAYVLATLWLARAHRWTPGTLLLGLACSIPPFATIWFERRVLDGRVAGAGPRTADRVPA